jgi:hypothetical protein
MKPQEFIKEEFSIDDEYSGEVSMVKNNLHTIVRVSVDLAKELKNNEDLPEWVEEKISLAKGMMVTVMDYMTSQHEMGVQPTVAENATGGGTSSGSIATTPMGGMVKRSQVGSLFGGTYQQPKKSKAKKK